MSRFKKLNEQLENVIGMLLDNAKLDKLLRNGNLMIENPSDSLMFNAIYPYPYIPTTTDKEAVFLNVWFDEFRLDSNNIKFKNYLVTFTILCHRNLYAFEGMGQLRPYSIMSEIDSMFNEQKIGGIGKLMLERDRFIAPNDYYSGYQLSYRVSDFN